MDINKPLAVITGANRGIGKAIAVRLAKTGYNIAALSRSINSAESSESTTELDTLITDVGAQFKPYTLDVSKVDMHQDIVDAVMNDFGRIDLLVNNAGVAPLHRTDILEATTESYDRVMGINLRGPYFFTQKIAGIMIKLLDEIENYLPKIIFISSVSAVMSSTNRGEYCISKAGLSMASQLFADRLSNCGIKVYELRPGVTMTDMTAPVKEKYDKMIEEGLIPQQRWGYPEDIAKTVVSIAEGNFDYSTGMVFEVSGGMNIRRL